MNEQALQPPTDLLIVEDSAVDAELVVHALRRGDLPATLRRVEDEAAFRAALADHLPDAILSDWTLPAFSGRKALAIAREVCPEIPFLFVSARLHESMAVDALRHGATDYVCKHQLDLLVPSLVRALAESRRRILHRAAESEALRSNRRYAALLEAIPDGVFEFDVDGRLLWANERWSELTGYPLAEGRGSGWLQMLAPDDVAALRAAAHEGRPAAVEYRIRRKDGAWRWIFVQVAPLVGEAGTPTHWVGTLSDISERKNAEAETQLGATVFRVSGEGIIITDARRRIVLVNRFFEQVTGYTAAEVLGKDPRLLKSGAHDAAFYAQMWATIAADGFWQGEMLSRRRNGANFSEWLTISAVNNAAGALTHYVGIFSDLTARKALDERVRRLTWYDALTGLPNRTLLTDRLEQALVNAPRFERSVALLTLDLARFRALNDTLGHGTGDAILVDVGRRIDAQTRPGDTVARLGADEFALVLVNLDQNADVIALARRVLDAIAAPMDIAGQRLAIAANVGIALFPKDGGTPEALFKAADIALERARQAGRNTFRFFTATMDLEAARYLRLESDLRQALPRGELCVHYQPQVDLVSGRICGSEALLRWTHPQLGPIPPAEFVPLAEEVGLIQGIGAWVLGEACHHNRAWQLAGHPVLPVAVNLSAHQFHQSDLVELISATLADSGLPASCLELELTEGAFIGDIPEAVAIVRRIKALGVRLSLDDFGTGYSSLAYLSRFPFDKIKIDQSFVSDITTNPVNAAIASATIAMGRSLDLVVLAEGIETEAQMQFLRARNCQSMQGWLFSKAVPADEFAALLATARRLEVRGERGAGGDTLLLVDDEPNILASLKRLLRRDGYSVLTAESPATAFELLARNRVQVVVSDQRMPGMSGTEFLSRVRQIHPETVRIVLSGHADLTTVSDAIKRGAIHRFLTKPWDDEVLRRQIREAFHVARGQAQD